MEVTSFTFGDAGGTSGRGKLVLFVVVRGRGWFWFLPLNLLACGKAGQDGRRVSSWDFESCEQKRKGKDCTVDYLGYGHPWESESPALHSHQSLESRMMSPSIPSLSVPTAGAPHPSKEWGVANVRG